MASEMYSTNPTLMGCALIVGGGWAATGRFGPGSATAAWVLLGIGLLLYAIALSITAGVGLTGTLKVCAVMVALASAVGAGLAWRGPLVAFKWACLAGGAVAVASGWIAAAVVAKRRGSEEPDAGS